MNNTASSELTNETRFNEEKSHALHYGWVFWFMHRSPGEKITNYEGAMKKIATFNTVNYANVTIFCYVFIQVPLI